MPVKRIETPEDFDRALAEANRKYPRVQELNFRFLRPRDVAGLRDVVENDGGERAIDMYLRGCPDVWSAFLHQNGTGHQGGLVLSQQVIRPAVPGIQPGLVPDFLISGESSDGVHWWAVELKSARASIFAGKGASLRLSQVVNQGVIQLLRYLDYCAKHQNVLREAYGLRNFREPRGILLVGRQEEMERSEERQEMKRIWNVSNHLLEIRTYDSFFRSLDHKLYFNGFADNDPPPLPGDHDNELPTRGSRDRRGYRPPR